MFEAFIEVVDPERVIEDAHDYQVIVTPVHGEPTQIHIESDDYDAIMKFMTEYFSMSPGEADIEVIENSDSELNSQPQELDNPPSDYEECGHCGFDHEYDYELAKSWHEENDPENKLYEKDEWDTNDDKGQWDIDDVRDSEELLSRREEDRETYVYDEDALTYNTNESFTYDKFVDDILLKEGRKSIKTFPSEARKRVEKYQERPLNRIRYVK